MIPARVGEPGTAPALSTGPSLRIRAAMARLTWRLIIDALYRAAAGDKPGGLPRESRPMVDVVS